MGLGMGFTGAEELAWQACARPVGVLGGQQRAGKNAAAGKTVPAACPLPLAQPGAHSLPDQWAGTEPHNLGVAKRRHPWGRRG